MNLANNAQLLVSSLNRQKDVHTAPVSYKSVFLSSVVPDTTNPRFLPAVLIEDEHAKLFVKRKITKNDLIKIYQAKDRVIIGKSCIINCLKYGSVDWKRANESIDSIIELGNNILVSELIQVPTIYPISDSKFQILTGHRRFFASVYANGYGSAIQFKLYKSKPLLTKVKQFQENASREDLPQYGKLIAFIDAITEINTLNTARLRVNLKKLTIKEMASNLGISMGAYDNYNVLTRYACVIDAYESGLSYPFVKTKKIVLSVESKFKAEYGKTLLNVTDKKKIAKEIDAVLFEKKQAPAPAKTYKIKSIHSSSAIKTILTTNITKLDTGIDWDNIDWEDKLSVSDAISTIIEFLDKPKPIYLN